MVRTDLGRQGQLLVVHVERDHRRRTQRSQQLHRDVSEAADADHHGRRTGHELRERTLDRVVWRQAGVGEADRLHRVEPVEGHDVA